MRRLDFFKEVSDVIAGNSGMTWGLASAALGNASNRRDFLDHWWPEIAQDQEIIEAVITSDPQA